MVAQFCSAHDLWADDPAFRGLLERLREESPELTGWWKTHDIRGTAVGEKRLHHPKKGALRFDQASFQSNGDPALRIVIFTEVKSAAARPLS